MRLKKRFEAIRLKENCQLEKTAEPGLPVRRFFIFCRPIRLGSARSRFQIFSRIGE